MKSIIRKIVINYLRLLSYIKLKFFFKGQIITLAGCYGKSSAINLIESIFSNEYKIYSSSRGGKGLNSETGIPSIILQFEIKTLRTIDWLRYIILSTIGLLKKLDHEVLLLELAVDAPGDGDFITSFIASNTGIVINSSDTHSVNFENESLRLNKSKEELIAYENGFIFERAKDSIIYNADDENVISQVHRFKGAIKKSFSKNNGAVTKFKPTLAGTEIVFNFDGKEYTTQYAHPLLEEYKETIEMALQLAQLYKMKAESIIAGIQKYVLPPSRCSLYEGINNSFLLDSSYNSSLKPAKAMLNLLNTLHQDQELKGRKIVIFGDMRELGTQSEIDHRKLAHEAKKYADIVLTTGPDMKHFFADEFAKIKTDSQKLITFEKTKDLITFVTQNNSEFIQANDIVLIKGSQNTLFLELLVEKLLKDKANSKHLGRRGDFWDQARAKVLA